MSASPARPCRIIAFDYGLKQIGVAVGNAELATTQTLDVMRARDGVPDWEAIAALCSEWEPDVLLVGDPINMDGTTSELALRARKFARRLEGRLGLSVELVDERLSSFEVKQQQQDRGHRGDYHKQPVDSLAAELILQDWLRQR